MLSATVRNYNQKNGLNHPPLSAQKNGKRYANILSLFLSVPKEVGENITEWTPTKFLYDYECDFYERQIQCASDQLDDDENKKLFDGYYENATSLLVNNNKNGIKSWESPIGGGLLIPGTVKSSKELRSVSNTRVIKQESSIEKVRTIRRNLLKKIEDGVNSIKEQDL